MQQEEIVYDSFQIKRKEDGLKLATKIRNNWKYQFRGQYLGDIIYQLFRIYSLIEFGSIEEAKKTGFINIQNKGGLYCREYIDLCEGDIDLLTIDSEPDIGAYDVEIIVKQGDLNETNNFINAMNEICGPADLLVKPQSIPGSCIFVWGSGKSYYGDLIASLYDEFGGESEIRKLPNSFKDSTALENKPAMLLKS